jgi:hypothetical protein
MLFRRKLSLPIPFFLLKQSLPYSCAPVELVATPMPVRALPFSPSTSKSAGNLHRLGATESNQSQQVRTWLAPDLLQLTLTTPLLPDGCSSLALGQGLDMASPCGGHGTNMDCFLLEWDTDRL